MLKKLSKKNKKTFSKKKLSKLKKKRFGGEQAKGDRQRHPSQTVRINAPLLYETPPKCKETRDDGITLYIISGESSGETETIFHSMDARPSFVKPLSILEFLANLLTFRIKEFIAKK